MGWEQRNADFCKAQTDAQMAYIEAEREVDQLQAENARLREEFDKMDVWHSKELLAAIDENKKLRELVRDWHALATGGADSLTDWNHEQADLERRMRELGVVE